MPSQVGYYKPQSSQHYAMTQAASAFLYKRVIRQLMGQAQKSAFKKQPKQSSRRQNKRSEAKQSRQVHKLTKQVRNIYKSQCDGESVFKFREINAISLKSLTGKQNVLTWGNPNFIAPIEVVLSQVPFFDPQNPAVLTTTDFNAGTYGKEMKIDSITSSIELINNYQSLADLTIYLCTIKTDSALSAHAAWQASVTDESNLTNEDDLGQYPTDYSLVNNLWNLKRVFKGVLQPGERVSKSHTVKDICYDPSDTDSQALTYQKRLKSFQYLCVLTGKCGHDTVANEQGILPAGLDCFINNSYIIKYDANGARMDRVVVSNLTPTAFTNSGVQSAKPEADNQGYSVA